MVNKENSLIECKICGIYMVEKCYKKHWWFHIVRDPLVWGMKYLAWCNGIDAKKYSVCQTRCKGCIRFIKAELTEKSPTFNFLNTFIGPWFSNIRNPMLTDDDINDAKRLADETKK
jgi:hypothetical protein